MHGRLLWTLLMYEALEKRASGDANCLVTYVWRARRAGEFQV